MALATSVTDGDQVLLSNSTQTRIFYTNEPNQPIIIRNVETIETKSEKWFALTQAAAEAERVANVQPEDADARNTDEVALQNQQTRAYTLTRTYTKVTKEQTYDGVTVPDVTFAPVAGTYPTIDEDDLPLPLEVTMNDEDPDAWIRYEIGQGVIPADPTTGSDVVPAGGAISVQLVAGEVTTIKAFAQKVGNAVSEVSSVEYTGESLSE
jgi:hypothetical protein